MAHSDSISLEAIVDPAEDSFAFTDDAVAILQPLLLSLVFMDEAEVLEKFLCQYCHHVALRPHLTNCHHLLCWPCFEYSLYKKCPVADCPNPNVIDEGKNVVKDQNGLRELRVQCPHQEYGCEEILSLQNLQDHKTKCKHRKDNLLPKLWQPTADNLHIYIEQLQSDLNILREVVKVMEDEMILLKEELLQKKEELLQIRHNEKGFASDIRLLQEQVEKLKHPQGTDIEKLVKDAVVEQWNLQKDSLILDTIKTHIHQQRMETTAELSVSLTRQLVKEEANTERNVIEKVKIQTTEMLTKHIKDLQEEMKMQSEEISNDLKHGCSREFQKLDDHFKELTDKMNVDHESFKQEVDEKMDKYHRVLDKVKSQMNELQMKKDESPKEVIGQQETIVRDMDTKIEECLRATDELKTRMEDSLRLKMESKNVKWIIGESCLGSSLSPEWMEWALEERRTEYVWKVPGVRSLLQRWKEGKGHLQSEVFVTKEFGFKIRAKLEYKFRKWINFSIEFVKVEGEATPTRPSVYFHRRTFVLMDQGEGGGPKRDIVHVDEPAFGKEEAQTWMKEFSGSIWFVPVRCVEGGAPYVMEDALYFRILIEPLSVLWKSFASNDGTLLWKIHDYSQKKKDSLEGVIRYLYSDYFYSSPRGYRIQIRFQIDSKGDLGMGLLFLRGEWDDSLGERFPHKITLTIRDRSNSERKKHLIRTKESDSTNGDGMGWILRSELESGPYLKDDCLVVKVVVEPKR